MTALEDLRPLSVSQYNSFKRCGYAWYLDRVLKAWNRPAAWLPQGSAVHTVAEHIERNKLAGTPLTLDKAQEMFGEEYSKEVEKYTALTPNLEWWFSSGSYSPADPDPERNDLTRRFHIGREQVQKLMDWTDNHPEEVIWIAPAYTDPRCWVSKDHGDTTVDGQDYELHDPDCKCRPETPGIEIGFDIELDGLRIRGFIDAVIVINGEVRVRDYKTGNTPGDDFQLGVYGLALAEVYGIEQPQLGDYYMAGKKGKPGRPTYPYKIGEWTRERVVEKFRELEANIQAGKFDPLPERSKCNFCDVQLSCEFSLA